jgi:hypothetical protein
MLQTVKTSNQVKMIPCSKCQGDMPELRKTQYGYDFCVNCSDDLNLVGKKRALPVQMGQGDHSWTETVIMEENEYLKHTEQEELAYKNIKSIKKENDEEERDLQGPFKIINNSPEEEF